jgi:hypothetical protein
MNNLLALTIMETIQKGEYYGYHTIKDDIFKMESFWDLTETDFRDAMKSLEDNKCILPKGGMSRGDEYRLNEDKDCIKIFTEKINKDTSKTDLIAEKDNLSLRLMKSQGMLIELQTREIKTKRIYAFFGAIGGAILGFILAHYKEILKIF